MTTFFIFGDDEARVPDFNVTEGPSDSPSFHPSNQPSESPSFFPSFGATLEGTNETTSYADSYYPTEVDKDSYYGYNDSSSGYGEEYGSDPYGYDSDPYGDAASSTYGGGYGGGGKKDYGADFYYGAMSVAVLTLGLVVVVEFILHRIDMSAIGKPFNQAVLDAVYRELAVLGIVELGVHLMQLYYEYDKDKKAVFADVHFLLFYTDIFNAFQAVIQAWATNVVSQKLWVRTEELELDHYVEIREEYDRVHKELYGVPPSDVGALGTSTRPDNAKDQQRRGGAINSLGNWIFRPDLKLKYKELLLQVRFHELRVYFLQAYSLPMKFKVSDYLMRSEQNVLISTVHISPAAWLWLTAICNLLYYLAGMIATVTGESNPTATFYSIVFFMGMVLFVIASLLLDKHMENIFHRIMKKKHLWAFNVNDADTPEHEDLAEEQRSLFFLGSPELVVTIIQFTQLGYAIALSTVFVYWGDMQKDEEFPAWPYLVSSVFFYILFVYNMARVIPRFTLCSNLGRLVDEELLRETVAMYKLKQAERNRTEDNDFYFHMGAGGDGTDNSTTSDEYPVDKTSKDTDSDSSPTTSSDMTATTVTTSQLRGSLSSASGIVAPMDLVNMDASELRELSRRQQRRKSRKAMSEGVALMRQATIEEEAEALTETPVKPRSDKKKSQSDGVHNMQLDEVQAAPSREMMLMDLVRMDTQSVRNVLESSGNSTRGFNDSSSGRRTKSRSSGVADMAMNDSSMMSIQEEDAPATAPRRRSQRTRSNSAEASIQQMRHPHGGTIQQAAPITTKEDTTQAVRSTGFRLPFDCDDGSIALSEVDDAHPAEHPHSDESHHEPLSMHQWLCAYFTSSNYRLGCHIGGTMICFFLVAMRVEGFLQKQCIIPEADYSWDLPLYWSFLLEALWLLIALAASLVVLLTFLSKEEDWNRNEWTTVIGAMMNVVLVGMCLAFLFGSEAQRCCTDSESDYHKKDEAYEAEGKGNDLYYDSRFLADYGYGKGDDVCTDATLECKCEDFGYRVYGGLGSLEPWTALIALQVFRFILAKKIAKWCGLGEKVHDHHDHGHGHGHGHGIGPEAIAEAWQTTVAKHPELVEKYGEFSSELLQAMLGLEVVERRTTASMPALTNGVSKEKSLVPSHSKGHLTLQDDQYKKLAPEVQEIIAAGRVGLPVKVSCRTLAAAPMAPLEFEVDAQQARVEQMQLTTTLECPNARIIRSVRRCDRMYLPLLNKWTAVDVILTNHEMVYIDVNDTDGSMEDQKKRIASTQALVATRGGKGLRLCDITAGRKIVGQLRLDDITAIHVDRELQKTKDDKWAGTVIDVDMEASKKHQQAHEIWQAGGDNFFDGSVMTERWEAVPQDKLHIDTNHGTLFLRFYSDLKECELQKERGSNKPDDTLEKDIAFQWAQTLVHLCVNQLKQPLPRFGQNNNEELRDYLNMVSC